MHRDPSRRTLARLDRRQLLRLSGGAALALAAPGAALAQKAKPIKVAAFVRLQLGEGVEKEKGDFAAEVAAAAGKK